MIRFRGSAVLGLGLVGLFSTAACSVLNAFDDVVQGTGTTTSTAGGSAPTDCEIDADCDDGQTERA